MRTSAARHLRIHACSALVLAAALSGRATAQSLEPIRHTIRFPEPHTHYIEVDVTVPTENRPAVELMMAAWTPGSYLIREYARHVEAERARTVDGQPRRIEKTRKNRWRIEANGASSVVVSYRLYCREMTVRTNWVERDFGMLNGAATFMTLVEPRGRPHEVRLELPDAWRISMTSLPARPGGGPHEYRAADFDTLVDSPIVVGNPAVYEFTVGGKPHYLVNVGEGDVWNGPRSAADVETIVRECLDLWGFLPYDTYVFLNMITESGGGLEHKGSTLMMTSRWRTRSRRGYAGWLGLVAHEYFHAWNVKRLRPAELGPFDYENEVYSRSLWMAEGVTSYYGDLVLRRSGLITTDEFLEGLSGAIRGLQSTPGRLVQPVESASYDAWIKGYRPDENSANSSISYYTKGQLIGFLLDAEIRRATDGAKTLDDFMRLAYQRYAGDRGFSPDQLQATAAEVAGRDLSAWFARVLQTTEELDYTAALAWFGLRFRPADTREPGKAWLGATTRTEGGRLLVSQVRRDTPAHAAGLNVDDEILAIDEYRVPPDRLAERLEQYRAGDRVSVLIARRERLVRIDVTLGEEPQNRWRLEADPTADPGVAGRRNQWLE